MSGKAYRLYGLALASPLGLPCPRSPRTRHPDVRLRAGSAARFARIRPRFAASGAGHDWFSCRRLDTGSTYLRWAGLFEFLVSPDGRDVLYHLLPGATRESLSAYLLGQVLSFSLLALGTEPVHGTVVVIDGQAVGFLGDCGYGKSTLGAAFLRLGHPILTDDLIALQRTRSGYAVHPGMPRLKLYPSVAQRVLGVDRGATPLNPGTSKLILPLGPVQAYPRPAPLRALYVLSDPRRQGRSISIAPLSPAAACLELVRNTFNTIVADRARLATQFRLASGVARAVPFRHLSYPRSLSALPEVREAVLADLS